ncbi:MAG: response regulator transcription factor [Lachnospiraceae bacterium]|jgi:two-component system response regulator RegX3|nr:response regulator transcription factor [Lachnospiraceae bacterium]
MSRILLVEDDVSLVDALRYALQKSGYETETARSASEAKERMEHTAYDLLLLDVALPDGTGFEVCEGVRKAGSRVPVIFLTAADDEMSIVRGLDGGGDDYVTKPFKLGELCSRIRALLRRSGISAEEGQFLRSGDIVVDLRRGRVMRGDEALDLTSAEFRLLGLFIRNEGIVVTRNMILEELWDSGGSFVDDNTLSVYVRRLREKIEAEPSAPKHLVTVRGFGYRWNGEKD